MTQVKVMTSKALGGVFGPKDRFSNFIRQWAADPNDSNSRLPNGCGNGSDSIGASFSLSVFCFPLTVGHSSLCYGLTQK